MQQIFLDIDGCLISSKKEKRHYYESLDLLSRLIELGNEGKMPLIAFCTGRDRNYVECLANALGNPKSWSVIESGVAFFQTSTKEMIMNPDLDLGIKKNFQEMSIFVREMLRLKFPQLCFYPGNQMNIAIEIAPGQTGSIEDHFQPFMEELKRFFGKDMDNCYTTHSDVAIDISPKGINKGTGLQTLAKIKNIELSLSVGVGDSSGDIAFLSLLEKIGCPKNASPDCKELVKSKMGIVSEYDYAAGVVDILLRSLRSEEIGQTAKEWMTQYKGAAEVVENVYFPYFSSIKA